MPVPTVRLVLTLAIPPLCFRVAAMLPRRRYASTLRVARKAVLIHSIDLSPSTGYPPAAFPSERDATWARLFPVSVPGAVSDVPYVTSVSGTPDGFGPNDLRPAQCGNAPVICGAPSLCDGWP
jgi:hypothetical protein